MEPSNVLIESPYRNSPCDTQSLEPVVPVEVTEVTVKLSPWGKPANVESVCFKDVMSEQLAVHLDREEKEHVPSTKQDVVYVDDLIGCGEDVTECSDDFLLAKLLQLEFDKEHDIMLKKEESKYNGGSKVSIDYAKYRRCMEESSSEEDDVEKDYVLEQNAKHYYHNIEQADKDFKAVGKSGVSRLGDVMTSKHDLTMCGRRNAGKLMELSPDISTGDGGLFDMKLPNHVYNSLRTYSLAEKKQGQKMHLKKDKSTVEKALDEKTTLILYKMVNNQTLSSLTGCISTGKEACVYHGWSGMSEEDTPPAEFAIKVYKTTLNEFQNRNEYVTEDHRFKNRYTKQNPRKVIHMWAEKEMRNLMRMKEAHIPCPEVVGLKKHVLVMSFIGKGTHAAPKINDVDLPFVDMTMMYEQTLQIMKTMYSECQLVHADLSEFNLLWFDGTVWVIDVSQAVDVTHSQAMTFLLRDCKNISTFFQKRGVLNVPSPEDMFFEVCGKKPGNIVEVQCYKKEKQLSLESD